MDISPHYQFPPLTSLTPPKLDWIDYFFSVEYQMKSMAYVGGPVVPIYVALNTRVIISSALWLMSTLLIIEFTTKMGSL